MAQAPDKSQAERLLFSRSDAARALGTSVATVMRIEREGRLKAIKLNPRKPAAKTYYRAQEVMALAQAS